MGDGSVFFWRPRNGFRERKPDDEDILPVASTNPRPRGPGLLALAGAFGGFVLAPATAQADDYVTSSTMRLSAGTWIVEGDVTVSEKINVDLSASVTLRLNDGATLNAQAGIEVPRHASLTIEGTGTLNATGSNGYAGIGGDGTVVINGGTINATGSVFELQLPNGNVAKRSASAIGSRVESAGGSVTINGGQVTATGVEGNPGIGAEGMTVTLWWTELGDFIESTSFEGTVGFAEGKRLRFADTGEEATPENLRGGRLLPFLDTSRTIVVVDAENGTVTPDRSNVSPADIVTLTANSPYPYAFERVTVETASGTSVDAERIDWTTWRFLMPDEDVTVTPVFPWCPPSN